MNFPSLSGGRRKLALGAIASVGVAAAVTVAFWPSFGDGPVLEYDTDAMLLDPSLIAVVAKDRLESTEMPWPFAEVKLTVAAADAGRSENFLSEIILLADEEGRVAIDHLQLWAECCKPEERRVTISASAVLDGKVVRPAGPKIVIPAIGPGAVEQMANRAAGEGDFAVAASLFRRLLVHDPERPDVWESLADAAAKAGRPVESIFAWREVLRLGSRGPMSSEEIRERVADITARMPIDRRPLPTLDAVSLVKQAQEKAEANLFQHALGLARAAQEEAPWWQESYELGGAMQIALWMERMQGSKSDEEEAPKLERWDLEQAIALGSVRAKDMLEGADEHAGKHSELRAATAAFISERKSLLESQ